MIRRDGRESARKTAKKKNSLNDEKKSGMCVREKAYFYFATTCYEHPVQLLHVIIHAKTYSKTQHRTCAFPSCVYA